MGKIPLNSVLFNVSNAEIPDYDIEDIINEEPPISYIPTTEINNKSSNVYTTQVEDLPSAVEVFTQYSETWTSSSKNSLRPPDGNEARQDEVSPVDYSFQIPNVYEKNSNYETDFSDEDAALWNNLDLDWMSKTDLGSEKESVTTIHPLYKTKIYEQSVSVLISSMKNDTMSIESLDRALEVGPWQVAQHQLPFLLGILAAFSLLVILITSLALYICFHRRRTSREFNVKSELSSGVIPSSNSFSRDSLIVVGSATNGHQAQLYTDSSAAHNLLFDRNFDFYFTLPKTEGPCESMKPSKSFCNITPDMNHLQFGQESNLKNQFSNPCDSQKLADTLERRVSTACEEMKGILDEDKSLRKGHSLKEITTECGSNRDRKRARREYSKSICYQGTRSKENKRIERKLDHLKTTSLPSCAWGKHSANKDKLLSSIYDKYCEDSLTHKMRRNRMRSDAAQVIALCKSKVPRNADEEDCGYCDQEDPYNCDETEAILNNNAVIIYNERTAL